MKEVELRAATVHSCCVSQRRVGMVGRKCLLFLLLGQLAGMQMLSGQLVDCFLRVSLMSLRIIICSGAHHLSPPTNLCLCGFGSNEKPFIFPPRSPSTQLVGLNWIWTWCVSFSPGSHSLGHRLTLKQLKLIFRRPMQVVNDVTCTYHSREIDDS